LPDCVDYVVHVPRNLHSIEITTDDGNLRISGVQGEVKVSSQYGTVSIQNAAGNLDIQTMHALQQVHLGEISGHRSIRLQSINGSIHLSLSRKSNANLLVASASGGLSNDFGWIPQPRKYESGRDLQGKLGSGDATIDIQEVNGSITLTAESNVP
jgi:DUF4097 and DUF4098 domain-containing protein YvlB